MEKKNVICVVVSAGLGLITGIFTERYHAMKNTPESVIVKLNTEKEAAKTAKKEADKAKSESEKALRALKATKAEYQAEVRKELEPVIRKEFADYIDKADVTYEKAKHEKEVADLKLELCKQYEKRTSNSNDDLNLILKLI